MKLALKVSKLKTIPLDVDTVHQEIIVNQPTTKETAARCLGAAAMKAKWNGPPLVGNADANSARPAAIGGQDINAVSMSE
ncbi:TGF beta receptor associated protein 1 [Aspergillus luchuensis]|uniref:TGF beta receptor associated protein 1 n=1 Tax=Aspergillus kawachii TaxID=1069201 RepID=A0A146FPE7_ASPKA|nr:TGF beta receptor associated protein 1 [Aspergillus luchuensis]